MDTAGQEKNHFETDVPASEQAERSELTYRQLEVLRLMADGYESKEIARLL